MRPSTLLSWGRPVGVLEMTSLEVVMPGDEVPLPSGKVGPGLSMMGEDCKSGAVSIAGLLKGAGPEEEGKKKRKKKGKRGVL